MGDFLIMDNQGSSMLPDTWDVRQKASLLSDQVLAAKLAEMYRQDVINSFDDIAEDAIIADEARMKFFGKGYSDWVTEELNGTITELTRPNGLVQNLLADHGQPMCLCSTIVSRKLTDVHGTEYVVKKTARFATEDAEIAAQYLLKPQYTRVQRSFERLALMTEEHINRIPALAQHTPDMINMTHRKLANQLPMPKVNIKSKGKP